jgi:hypothetical protein
LKRSGWFLATPLKAEAEGILTEGNEGNEESQDSKDEGKTWEKGIIPDSFPPFASIKIFVSIREISVSPPVKTKRPG